MFFQLIVKTHANSWAIILFENYVFGVFVRKELLKIGIFNVTRIVVFCLRTIGR